MPILRPLLLALLLSQTAVAAVWQYRLTVPIVHKGEEQTRQTFLWLPAEAERIRGVLVGGMTLAERDLAEDPAVRAVCREHGLAIIFSFAGLRQLPLQPTLDRFAERSGYGELAHAPLFFVGHSAGGPQARDAAAAQAARCFGLMLYRGGLPLGGEPPVPPGVPCLVMLGQFDEFGGRMRTATGLEPAWMHPRDALAAARAREPGHLVSLAVEPGAGHFSWSQRNADYFAAYLAAAARARIPEDPPGDPDAAVRCRTIDPATGWLGSLALENPAAPPPAPVADYTGDPDISAWFFDGELARATAAYHAGLVGKRDQFIRWQDRYWLDAGARYFFLGLDWIDHATFAVHPAYAESYPGPTADDQPPRWARAGEPCSHAATPIAVKAVSGPLVATADQRLTIRYRATAPADRRPRLLFMAYSPGDADHRYSELVGYAPRGFHRLKQGAQQTITFPEPPDLSAGADPLPLQATSDAGLPVSYYVAYGPARIVDGALVLDQIPQRAPLPLEIAIVAWQFGSGIDPRTQTAQPITRTLWIVE
ncbi:MAG: hypothetical protein ACOCYV_02265 [Planctomycetota bacterium]